MFAQIMFVQIASTLPPPLHIPLFIGITDAVEATHKSVEAKFASTPFHKQKY